MIKALVYLYRFILPKIKKQIYDTLGGPSYYNDPFVETFTRELNLHAVLPKAVLYCNHVIFSKVI